MDSDLEKEPNHSPAVAVVERSGGIIAGIPEVDGAKVWDALFVEAEKAFETLNANVQAVLPDAAADGAARKKRRMNSVLDDSDDIFSLFQLQAPVVAVRSDASVTVSDEIKRYKALRPEALGSDPLLFWKRQQHAFPLLSQLARRYLCIPATSAASERTFSTAGNVITKHRASLKPDMVGTIMLLYGSWRIVDEYWAKRDKEEGKGLVVIDD